MFFELELDGAWGTLGMEEKEAAGDAATRRHPFPTAGTGTIILAASQSRIFVSDEYGKLFVYNIGNGARQCQKLNE